MREFFWFVVVGTLAFFIDFFITNTVYLYTDLSHHTSRLLGFSVSVFFSWILNRKLSFRTVKKPSVYEFVKYIKVSAGGLIINYISFLAVFKYTGLIFISVACGSISGMLFNFIFYRKVVFDER